MGRPKGSKNGIRNLIDIRCETCNNNFKVKKYRRKTARFCSSACSKTLFGKGQPFIPHSGYKLSEQTRIRMSISRMGSRHPQWKGPRKIDKDGYVYIYIPTHPFCNRKKQVFEHRLVMEKNLGRFLDPKEVVHHMNGIKDDNRLENLKLFKNNSEHMKSHHPKGLKFQIKNRNAQTSI